MPDNLAVENPLVVFFKQSCAQRNLPVGFKKDGTGFDPMQDQGEALLIILDEEANQVPQLVHTNQDKSSPLPVIVHNENDLKKQGLKCYGEPKRVTGFSHDPKINDIFAFVLKLLIEDGDNAQAVPNFVANWRRASLRQDLNKLTAAIQCLELLGTPQTTELKNVEEDVRMLYKVSLTHISQKLSEKVKECVDNREFLTALNAIQEFASQDMSRSVQ